MVEVSPKSIGCWIKRALLGLGACGAAIVGIFAAVDQLDRVRPWASAAEIKIVADRLYDLSVPEQRRVIASIERDLKMAKAVPPGNRDINDQLRIRRLEEELAKAKETMDKLQQERMFFRNK